jgi:D-glycero-D-manno-heptose 1,7-bisphosphate phosphatase
MRAAAFLDRDGTIIKNIEYLDDPAGVELIQGAAEGIRMLRAAGYACVVVTNQSAIGRGLLTIPRFREIQAEVERQLHRSGAELDATYFCPVVPSSDDRSIVEHEDRKPGAGMLRRAATDLGLDLARSWMVGDMISDACAGRNAGCRGSILVCPETPAGEDIDGAADYVAQDLLDAARLIIRQDARPVVAGEPL